MSFAMSVSSSICPVRRTCLQLPALTLNRCSRLLPGHRVQLPGHGAAPQFGAVRHCIAQHLIGTAVGCLDEGV